jgi:hypothetical protein
MKAIRKAMKNSFEKGQSDAGYWVAKSEYVEDKKLIARLNRIIIRKK